MLVHDVPLQLSISALECEFEHTWLMEMMNLFLPCMEMTFRVNPHFD